MLDFVFRAIRYGASGIVQLGLDVGLFAVLVAIYQVPPAAAQLVSRSAGAALGFVINQNLVFRAGGGEYRETLRQLAEYGALVVFNIALSAVLLSIAVDGLLWPLWVGKSFTEATMVTWTFVASHWVFRRKKIDDHVSR